MEIEDEVVSTGPSQPGLPQARYSLTVNSASVFAVYVAVQAVGFIGSLFVYRFVGGHTSGQALYGTVQFFLLIASTINTLADLRVGYGYQLLVARGRSPYTNTGTYLLLRFLLVGLVGLIVLGFGGVNVAGAIIAPTTQDLEILGLFMLLPVFWTLEAVYLNYFTGTGNALKGQYPNLVEVFVRTPVLIFAALFLPSLLGLSYAFVIGAAAGGLFCLPALWPLLRRFRKSEAILLLKFSWPLLGALGLSTAATTLTPFFVQASLGAALLNQFNLVNGFRILLIALPTAVATPLFPYVAALHKRQNYHGIRDGMWNAIRYSSMVLIPGVVAMTVYRVNILQIVNHSYVGGASALALLAIGTIPAAIALILGTGLAAIGWRRLEFYLTGLQVILLFAICFALLPPYGILPRSDGLVSASIAVLASSTAAFGLNAWFVYRLMRVRIFPRSILFIVLSALIAFLAISRVNAYLPTYLRSNLALLVIGLIVGTLVYTLVLALVGELAKEDVYRIGRSMDLPRGLLRFPDNEEPPGPLPP
ncbi:MAG: polysaccharide biosynthesis C-terminal domain-containing protein [Thermoplasmatales archaeon]|nr:polysaccharide biosynthesis C-terminal domain-containing protein [Thermoplasmatales archaeon]